MTTDTQLLELELLFEGLFKKYGYDFRNYAKGSAQRRVEHRMGQEGLENISAVQHLALHDKDFADRLLKDLSVNVTEMFRDPDFYLQVRGQVVPILKELKRSLGHLKTWHAGCSTGEEVYSTVILLREENLRSDLQIFATDFNNKVLMKAKRGIVPLNSMKKNISNYQQSGGCLEFAEYYNADYEGAQLDQSLLENIVFSRHNLATDSSFGEMQMIVCRNVLIYFDSELQERVFKLFDESLCEGGILCLGSKESLRFSKISSKYETISSEQRIYRKKLTTSND